MGGGSAALGGTFLNARKDQAPRPGQSRQTAMSAIMVRRPATRARSEPYRNTNRINGANPQPDTTRLQFVIGRRKSRAPPLRQSLLSVSESRLRRALASFIARMKPCQDRNCRTRFVIYAASHTL